MSSGNQWGRRDFVKSLGALAGAAGVSAYDMRTAAAEPSPETTRVRLIDASAMCLAPQYIAKELLHAEGFSDVEYVPYQAPAGKYTPLWLPGMIAEGTTDFSMGGVVWYPP